MLLKTNFGFTTNEKELSFGTSLKFSSTKEIIILILIYGIRYLSRYVMFCSSPGW
jgi:hypothetical protein